MTVRLAIDSTSDRLSIAADRNRGTPESAALQGARRHAGALLPMIDDVLGRLGATARDVSVVAVADGPGSFTGIRVSFAAAKALAAEGAMMVTAPSLMVRAAHSLLVSSSHRPGSPLRVLAISSALRGEVYAGIWSVETDRIETVMAPRTISARDIAALPAFDDAVGDGPEDFLAAVRARREWPEAATLLQLIDVPGGARVIAAPLDFEPHYGRPAEAAAKWEREHGRPLPDPTGHGG
ncbi:MAG TPA: tRNA (adenosine(37)-N6)-threonylcarbamoyltransferase complex dimerization subunit type 1 TsaB [Gemmatimonadales bacterium]|nr:tRNA (adenosine(37)-N6)-threonylcarbamoyltransferase complex dimerization subunit type 1 TsaB [Gemmatimonadales bacterium]